MKKSYQIFFGMIFSLHLFSCGVSKKIPDGEKIYAGAKFDIIKNDSLEAKIYSDIKTQLAEISRPLQNTHIKLPFIGPYPYKVGVFYALGQGEVKKGLKGFLAKTTKNFSEKPVFVNELIVKRNQENFTELLKTKGFFSAKVLGKLEPKGALAFVNYQIHLGNRHKIDSIEVLNGASDFHENFVNAALPLGVSKGEYFDLEKIKLERIKIDQNLRKNGYFYFRPDYVGVWADSTNQSLAMEVKIGPKEEIPAIAKKQYQINDIFVNINKSSTEIIPHDEDSFDFFRGLILDDQEKKYKENIFKDAIAFRPGTFFNTELQDITNTRMLGLANFKFIKSRFEVINRLDSSLIDVHYFLQTQKKKSLRFEANAITRSSGLAGSQLSLNWQNINTFKGAELLKLSALGGLEFQVGGDRDAAYRGNYRLGFEGSLTVPKFLAPLVKIDPEISRVLPKTLIMLGYESFIKTGLYNLNSARASLNYAWTRGRGIEHNFRPLSVNFIKASNISTVFIDEIFADPRLLVILENQFVAGGAYEITVQPKQYHRGNLSYRANVDFAGNIFGLIDKIRNDPEKTGRIFGEYYSQFLRTEQDVRYRYDINKSLQWANRAIIGVGLPYGNSLQLPFVNQFYAGGNNSLRAFRARGVGPGTYERSGSLAEQFLGNNTGDIKLEFNTEMRLKINNFLNTALFFDAGNVWMFKDEYIYGEGSLFSKNFYREMAVGTGIGLRFNLSFIIFRVDLATPLRKPWLPEGDRWVFNEWQLRNRAWRKDNFIWNIAVGLPF
jgi:hypothetical protein